MISWGLREPLQVEAIHCSMCVCVSVFQHHGQQQQRCVFRPMDSDQAHPETQQMEKKTYFYIWGESEKAAGVMTLRLLFYL